MTSNDKKRQKLVESMRKTKANSSKNIEGVDTKQAIALEDNKPIIKKKKNATTNITGKDTQKFSVDSFRSARRVWPD